MIFDLSSQKKGKTSTEQLPRKITMADFLERQDQLDLDKEREAVRRFQAITDARKSDERKIAMSEALSLMNKCTFCGVHHCIRRGCDESSDIRCGISLVGVTNMTVPYIVPGDYDEEVVMFYYTIDGERYHEIHGKSFQCESIDEYLEKVVSPKIYSVCDNYLEGTDFLYELIEHIQAQPTEEKRRGTIRITKTMVYERFDQLEASYTQSFIEDSNVTVSHIAPEDDVVAPRYTIGGEIHGKSCQCESIDGYFEKVVSPKIYSVCEKYLEDREMLCELIEHIQAQPTEEKRRGTIRIIKPMLREMFDRLKASYTQVFEIIE